MDPEDILKKCRDCRNEQRITEMQKRLDEGEDRFRKIEYDLKENNRVTTENNRMVKEIHEFFFKDTSERQSVQSTLMLNTTQILSKLRVLKPEVLTRYRVNSLALFGSAARGTHTSTSDIDVLVDFDESATLFELVGLGQYLEEQLECKVDVVPRRALRPESRENVLREAVPV